MALQTITSFTVVQNGVGQATVNFTIADADSDTLALQYQYSLDGANNWKTPTLSGLPSTVSATPSGVALTGTWNIDANYAGNLATASLDFKVTSTKAAVKATGSVTAVAADPTTGIAVGDTVSIGAQTFEFSTSGTVTSSNVAVLLPSATATAAQVKTAISSAVNGSSATDVVATSGAGQLIVLTAKVAGVLSDTTAESLSNSATLTPTGMTGGVDTQVVAATSVASLTTGSVGESHDTLAVDTIPNSVEAYKLDQFGKYGTGVLPQAYMKKSIVYEMLDLLRSGARTKFEFVADRAGLHQRRAVLISVAEYNRVRGTDSIEVMLKSKQWLAYYANKAMSTTTFFDADKRAYAISENVINTTTGIVSQNVIAYLMSGVQYTNLVH